MSKVIIWGTGSYERRIFSEGITADIVGYLETTPTISEYRGYRVFSFDTIPDDYDFIICAFMATDEAFRIIEDKGIDYEKVVFLKPGRRFRIFNDDERINSILSEKTLYRYYNEYGMVDAKLLNEDIAKYSKENKDSSFDIHERNLYPIVREKYASAGDVDFYFWQDLWAAKRIIASKVKSHWDVGSRINGFVSTLLAADIEVNVIDVRPLDTLVEGMHFVQDDATELENVDDNSIDSFSAICSIEHFGLGRYGDPIRPDAWEVFINRLQRKMKSGGNIFISVPVGEQRVEFNAHRVFYPQTIIDKFSQCNLVEFSGVERKGKDICFDLNVDIHRYDNWDMRFGVGLFWFRKK